MGTLKKDFLIYFFTDEKYDIFKDVEICVDLCSAPGSWSQIATKVIKPDGLKRKIVSVDIQKMVTKSTYKPPSRATLIFLNVRTYFSQLIKKNDIFKGAN